MRKYKSLNTQIFQIGEFKISPIRDEDKFEIMRWRNNQIELLRQKKILTRKEQEDYFKNIISKLFAQKHPTQLLFSFFQKKELIGYGGLVHINWENRNAEISFLLDPKEEVSINYHYSFVTFLKLMENLGQSINFRKIYTYGYDINEGRFLPLIENDFDCEVIMKDQVLISDKLHNVRIYSKFINGYNT